LTRSSDKDDDEDGITSGVGRLGGTDSGIVVIVVDGDVGTEGVFTTVLGNVSTTMGADEDFSTITEGTVITIGSPLSANF
jgi:hypothetical protein